MRLKSAAFVSVSLVVSLLAAPVAASSGPAASPVTVATATTAAGVSAQPVAQRRAPRPKPFRVTQFTPTSRAVFSSRSGKTSLTTFAQPAFRRSDQGWERLSGKVTRAGSGWSVASAVVPTRFPEAGVGVRLQLPEGPVSLELM